MNTKKQSSFLRDMSPEQSRHYSKIKRRLHYCLFLNDEPLTGSPFLQPKHISSSEPQGLISLTSEIPSWEFEDEWPDAAAKIAILYGENTKSPLEYSFELDRFVAPLLLKISELNIYTKEQWFSYAFEELSRRYGINPVSFPIHQVRQMLIDAGITPNECIPVRWTEKDISDYMDLAVGKIPPIGTSFFFEPINEPIGSVTQCTTLDNPEVWERDHKITLAKLKSKYQRRIKEYPMMNGINSNTVLNKLMMDKLDIPDLKNLGWPPDLT
ncbi:MAG: hypothetical protein HQK83_07100 [Fibrobacteria bacterium]|nr:hypothetical protein [Fibrobacteria bacterium]